MKIRTLSLLALAALAACLIVAQEISTPVSDGANEAITLKKVVRISYFSVERGGEVRFTRERIALNNSGNADVSQAVRLPATVRRVSDVLNESVTVGAKTVTFQQFLDLAAKFEATWRAVDETPK